MLSGPVVITLSADEAEAVGHQLAAVLKLAYGARGNDPPWLLRAFSDQVNAAARAGRGRVSGHVSVPRGPAGGHGGPSPRPSDQPATLTVEQAATLAEVHPRTVRKWIARREVDASRGPGGAYRVDIASLASWIRARREVIELKAA